MVASTSSNFFGSACTTGRRSATDPPATAPRTMTAAAPHMRARACGSLTASREHLPFEETLSGHAGIPPGVLAGRSPEELHAELHLAGGRARRRDHADVGGEVAAVVEDDRRRRGEVGA